MMTIEEIKQLCMFVVEFHLPVLKVGDVTIQGPLPTLSIPPNLTKPITDDELLMDPYKGL